MHPAQRLCLEATLDGHALQQETFTDPFCDHLSSLPRNLHNIPAAVILARMDSQRFPGKILASLAGMPILEHIARRLAACRLHSRVLATTSRSCDDPLVDAAAELGLQVYRGPDDEELNVAKRLLSAGLSLGATAVVRINGDSPCPIPDLIDHGMSLSSDDTDLITNLLPRTYPYGTAVEILNLQTLARELPRFSLLDREHVTSFYYSNIDRFRISLMPSCAPKASHLRFTIDTPSDLRYFERLAEALDLPLESTPLCRLMAKADSLCTTL